MYQTYVRFGIPLCFLFEFCESANNLRIIIFRSSTYALNSTQSTLHFDGVLKFEAWIEYNNLHSLSVTETSISLFVEKSFIFDDKVTFYTQGLCSSTKSYEMSSLKMSQDM